MSTKAWDVQKIRQDFPILARKVQNGKKDLVFLDSGASAQKPASVINAMRDFYLSDYANVHRGVHELSQISTNKYEAIREKLCRFFGTDKEQEFVITSGTTQSMNIVSRSWGEKFIRAGDTILVTRMEHHANFVPWQQLAIKTGAKFRIVEMTHDFRLDEEDFLKALKEKPKLVAFTHMSNVLGTINPVKKLAEAAKEVGAIVVVDAAQSAAHFPVNISKLGPIDFLALSSHKLCGPTGVGILWARESVLKTMDPYQYGGDMIMRVGDQVTSWNDIPMRFEAGTPAIAEVIGFGLALDYLMSIDRESAHQHEIQLMKSTIEHLSKIEGLTIFGPRDLENRGAVVSFAVDGLHPHDLAQFLDAEGIAVRAGHHCAQPLLSRLGISATTRASFLFYNTQAEVEFLTETIQKAKRYFNG